MRTPAGGDAGAGVEVGLGVVALVAVGCAAAVASGDGEAAGFNDRADAVRPRGSNPSSHIAATAALPNCTRAARRRWSTGASTAKRQCRATVHTPPSPAIASVIHAT